MVRLPEAKINHEERQEYMRVVSVTFAIGRAMPLQPISGRAEDAYASVKPMASCTVELDAGDDVAEARNLARSTAFEEMQAFSAEFRALYRPKSGEGTS